MSTAFSPRRSRRGQRPADTERGVETAAADGRHTPPAAAGPAPAPTAAPSADAESTPTFAELGVPAPSVKALAAQGIDRPFPIQVATLPDTLAGRDVLGRGRTGSGKTLAFSLPLVARLAGGTRRARQARGLVLVPTRELANQVLAVVEPLAAAAGLTSTVVFGGVGQGPQVKALSRGVDILIACPGRLEDLIGQGFCDLSGVEITVLDEADHMADLGFLPGVKRILDRTPRNGQRLLFSATLDNGVDVLVKRYLTNPTTHSVDPAVAPVETMTHHVFSVSAADKASVIHELASGMQRSLLFMRTKHTAKRLAKQLSAAGIPAVELHGNLSQNARERNLAAFTDGSTRVLVATDIAARGIHVDDVAIVVHVDPPNEHKAYLHRSGRTARAGAGGTVVTLALPDQERDVKVLARQAGIRPTTVSVRPGSEEITRLVGPPAPKVEYVPSRDADQPRQPGNRPRSKVAGRSSAPRQGAAPGARSGAAAGRGGSGGGRSGGSRSGAAGPARTRSELAARAGQPPAGRRRAR
ncbi:DEAD/DEAH box helicase [Acidiferrimicrobium sp. IK]|uniref:DEAD/DEAH box helicase n=1 Tax=Acidiferrimicrobium sp. IK TaxID=2871700 RepID=UPI0021CB1162|nr:DEAD/DEAH box helicase [Acidiferrimicrobium sp. IK]MCU4182827.1 DEAD/DEAH box helicase [Acidiferrimicrobium sp. IK]